MKDTIGTPQTPMTAMTAGLLPRARREMEEEAMTKEPREFALGDILSITTDRLVSDRHMDGVYDILNYMTGESLFTHQLPRASDECKPFLLAQHPQLDDPEITVIAIGKLILMLESLDRDNLSKKDRANLIVGWLSPLRAKYGDTLPVVPLPKGRHEKIDPITELAATGKKVVVVDTRDRS